MTQKCSRLVKHNADENDDLPMYCVDVKLDGICPAKSGTSDCGLKSIEGGADLKATIDDYWNPEKFCGAKVLYNSSSKLCDDRGSVPKSRRKLVYKSETGSGACNVTKRVYAIARDVGQATTDSADAFEKYFDTVADAQAAKANYSDYLDLFMGAQSGDCDKCNMTKSFLCHKMKSDEGCQYSEIDRCRYNFNF